MPLPFIPFPHCAEVVVTAVIEGVENLLTFGVEQATDYNSADLSDLADVIQNWVSDQLVPILCNIVTFTSVKCTDLSSVTGPTVTVPISGDAIGDLTANAVPAQVAAVVSFYTGLRGRSYRGRNYLFGFPLSYLADGSTLNAANATAFGDAYSTLQAILNADFVTLVILSRYEGGVRRSEGVSTGVTSIVGKTRIATQRRRIVGVGA
jgi:hypothetical protein